MSDFENRQEGQGEPPSDPSGQPGGPDQPPSGSGWPPPPPPPGGQPPPSGYPPPGYQQGYPPPGYQQGYQGYAPGPPKTEGMAVAALIVAIASFAACPVIAAVVALVLAGRAKANIDASRGTLGGEGLVTAARIISWINIALSVLFIGLIIVVAIFGEDTNNFGVDDFDTDLILLPLSRFGL